MIGQKFTNNLQDFSRKIYEDPFEWAIARNLAYASIRDDVEKIVKQTNENSADVFINADNLLQNLKARKINQYIDAGTVTQNISLSTPDQLKQIFMNSEVYQTINYVKKQEIVKTIIDLSHHEERLFYNNKYGAVFYNIKDGTTSNHSNNNIQKLWSLARKSVINNNLIPIDKSIKKVVSVNGLTKENVFKNRDFQFWLVNGTVPANPTNFFRGDDLFALFTYQWDDNGVSSGFILLIINLESYKLVNSPGKRNLSGNLFGKKLKTAIPTQNFINNPLVDDATKNIIRRNRLFG